MSEFLVSVFDSRDPAWHSANRYQTARGYVLLSKYAAALGKSISRYEHIVAWEKCNGGQVQKGWVIHHGDENSQNNDPANLVALPRRLHRELHVQLRHLTAECRGLEYLTRRYEMTKEFVRRSTELDDLRREWTRD